MLPLLLTLVIVSAPSDQRAAVAAAIAWAALSDREPPPITPPTPAPEPEAKPPAEPAAPTPAERPTLPEVAPTKRPEQSVLQKTPRVQVVIVGEAWCGACVALHREIEKQLVTDIRARREQPWRVGTTKDCQFRFVTVDEFATEFEPFPLRPRLPQLFFVVDGQRTETPERQPARLAVEFISKQQKHQQQGKP